jgi:hypothetical protein
MWSSGHVPKPQDMTSLDTAVKPGLSKSASYRWRIMLRSKTPNDPTIAHDHTWANQPDSAKFGLLSRAVARSECVWERRRRRYHHVEVFASKNGLLPLNIEGQSSLMSLEEKRSASL